MLRNNRRRGGEIYICRQESGRVSKEDGQVSGV